MKGKSALTTGNADLTRRSFVAAASVAAALSSSESARGDDPRPSPATGESLIKSGSVILFQGDSITDAGRSRETASKPNDFAALGTGYAWLAAASLLVERAADQLKIFNRGISGNKVFQLAERWPEDCLELKPDLLSILIGVNDYWHTLTNIYQGSVETYEKDFHALIVQTKKTLPDTQLVICEPFVLRCGAVTDAWFPAFDAYRATARRVATMADATFVPFQQLFDEAAKLAPPEHWAADGVHPTTHGAALMACAWLKAVGA